MKVKTDITFTYKKKVHAALCFEAIESVPGKFKVAPNMIAGADFQTTPPYLVQTELENWRKNFAYQLQSAKNDDDIVESICRQHIQFERIKNIETEQNESELFVNYNPNLNDQST